MNVNSPEEYEKAISKMDDLINDYERNHLLIDELFPKIEAYENSAEEFKEFNRHIASLDSGASMLRVLMDQHRLDNTSFEYEIGNKDLVSMICDEENEKKLTYKQIRKLSERFKIDEKLFF